MNEIQELQIINAETNLQSRLKLLVDHNFIGEASWLIWEAVYTRTAMFHFDWHDPEFCRPLPRVTENEFGVYVICHSGSKLDHSLVSEEGARQSRMVFELGWEQKALGWKEEESLQLARAILAQALARPLNQWSFKQAEGTGRAARRLLPAKDPMAREIAALHLVYQLREADFGHICDYLADIPGFPFVGGGFSKELDEGGLVNWIVDQLLGLGWTRDRIRKELVEWIWLKTDTWPQWLLAVAKAKVFAGNDEVRATAIRRWVRQRFDHLLPTSYRQGDWREVAEALRELFPIGQFASVDAIWILRRLVKQAAAGKVSSVAWFVGQFKDVLELEDMFSILTKAQDAAEAAGDFGILVGLKLYSGQQPDARALEIVKIRGLSTRLE